MDEKQILEIRVPRENEYTPEAAVSLFSSLAKNLSSPSFWDRLRRKKPTPVILEIGCFDQKISFFLVVEKILLPFLESQILATYPLAVLSNVPNFMTNQTDSGFHFGQMVQSTAYYYPLKTYKEFTDVDPLTNILAVMSKAKENDFFLMQLVLTSAPKNWQSHIQAIVEKGISISAEEKKSLPGESLIKQKTEECGIKTGIRIATSSSHLLNDLVGSFGSLTRGDGNSLKFLKPLLWQKSKLKQAILNHESGLVPKSQILNASELATLWHLPGKTTQIPNIAWGRAILSEPPENLPTSLDASEETKQQICFIGRTEFKNRLAIFGIKRKDRRRHNYIIGKTGTGKSWLLANMAIDDFKKGRGVAVVDPHGDLCEILLDYIPSNRINEVCYFNPADRENPLSLNILEVVAPIDAELVTSGIVSIFYKLYGNSWGPRLEYILRNTVMSLANIPGSTLVDVLRILSDKKFREKTVEKLTDPILISFWRQEFEKMPDSLQKEAVSPIQNKVGQFVTSPLIRGIIGHSHSSLTMETFMDEGKILLVNLSQGSLGEDNSALLGAMIITKIQQAAMHRVRVPEEQRKDFYLYVDEFQNFATSSFIKILSEARKYRLNLTLANQYMAQIDPEIQSAIFGNTGTLISFVVGANDAPILEKEYGTIFTQNDMVSLDRYQIALKLTIDDQISRPFLAFTLPLPKSKNQNREKVVRVSRERYAYKKEAPASVPEESSTSRV